jgi:membrane protein insertase Oxa1/YidC/SpoIIIJ
MLTASVVVRSNKNTISSCDLYSKKDKGSNLLNVASYGIFTFLLPLLLITVSNVITLVTMCTHKKISQERSRQQRTTRKTTRIVVSISIMHCISTCPYAIYMYSVLYNPLVEIWKVYEYIIISYFLNSGFNFILKCLS